MGYSILNILPENITKLNSRYFNHKFKRKKSSQKQILDNKEISDIKEKRV